MELAFKVWKKTREIKVPLQLLEKTRQIEATKLSVWRKKPREIEAILKGFGKTREIDEFRKALTPLAGR